jgi:hypothetical protein
MRGNGTALYHHPKGRRVLLSDFKMESTDMTVWPTQVEAE